MRDNLCNPFPFFFFSSPDFSRKKGLFHCLSVFGVQKPKRMQLIASERGLRLSLVTVWVFSNLPGTPRESLISRGTSVENFFRQSLRTFHCFSDFELQKPKKMRPWVASWACLEKHWVHLIRSDTVLQPPKFGFNTVRPDQVNPVFLQTSPWGNSGSHLLWFCSSKSEKQWKVLRDCLKKFSTEVPREIRLSLGASPLGKI